MNRDRSLGKPASALWDSRALDACGIDRRRSRVLNLGCTCPKRHRDDGVTWLVGFNS